MVAVATTTVTEGDKVVDEESVGTIYLGILEKTLAMNTMVLIFQIGLIITHRNNSILLPRN